MRDHGTYTLVCIACRCTFRREMTRSARDLLARRGGAADRRRRAGPGVRALMLDSLEPRLRLDGELRGRRRLRHLGVLMVVGLLIMIVPNLRDPAFCRNETFRPGRRAGADDPAVCYSRIIRTGRQFLASG